MEWLQSHAQVVQLREIVNALVDRRPLPERAVVLTFDDGFRNFYLFAAPVLRRLGLPATIFLPTSYCGRANSWPGQPSWVAEEPLLNWDQVRELACEGFQFGAHTVSHHTLTALTLDEAEREITESKIQIEKQTNRPVEFFSYPYGRWSPAIRDIVVRHYKGACATTAGMVAPSSDPFSLPRADAHYLRHLPIFKMLLTKSFPIYLASRRLIRRVRREPEGGPYPKW
jgi:peptidoglycan/xylan/chitin deacetylase (PgdA/CDA1 family)